MNTLKQSAALASFAALMLVGCAHHNQAATTTTNDIGTITAEQASQTGVIPGPAKVDKSGNVYTSSAAPGSGASLNDGTNTNVNIIPKKSTSQVTVSQSPITESAVSTGSTTVTTMETTAPTPVVETTQTTTVSETTPAMTSSSASDDQSSTTSTSTTTTRRHRRMAKD